MPESLNSPDVGPAPRSGPPGRDDPLMQKEMMASSLHVSRKDNLAPSSGHNKMTQSLHSPRQSGFKSSSSTPMKQAKTQPTKVSKPMSTPVSARKTAIPANKQVSELKKTSSGSSIRKQRTSSRQSSITDGDSSHSESDSDFQRRQPRRKVVGDTSRVASKQVPPLQRSMSAKSVPPESAKYAPERYSSNSSTKKMSPASGNPHSSRPGSAPTTQKPRSASANPTKKQFQSSTLPSGKSNASATTIQKHWRGHQTRNNDEKVQDLKKEVRSLRTEEHIKFLTKELQTTKESLEQERKLRSLQMDAIKVLWKEVQMMDATKANPDKTRPSGSFGSKISSRSSEYSIAKLMETLEATTEKLKVNEETESDTMERSKPTSEDTDAVKRLNDTCNSLQSQVEQLQSSLTGMMRFMSSISANMEHIQQHSNRTRHSSSTSTNHDTPSFQFYSGPGSLPPSMFASMVDPANSANMFMSLEPSNRFQEQVSPRPDLSQSCHNFKDSSDKSVLSVVDIPLDEALDSGQRSPRPSTLPGLNEKGQGKQEVKAPTEVKNFATHLVQGLLEESIVRTVNESEQKMARDDDAGAATDVSLSLGQEEVGEDHAVGQADEVSCSSVVDTDSLDESSSIPKKKH